MMLQPLTERDRLFRELQPDSALTTPICLEISVELAVVCNPHRKIADEMLVILERMRSGQLVQFLPKR